jgi:hypothetical protein
MKCSFDGCYARTERPYADGWSSLTNYGPGIRDGFYCREHAAAIERVLLDGGLDER